MMTSEAIIKGRIYRVGPVQPIDTPSYRRGFEGRVFTIRFCDGRIIGTRNLWWAWEREAKLAEVPADNAEFVPEAA